MIFFSVLQTSLDMDTRSPQSYSNRRKAGTLKLPHPKHLQKIKNYVSQTPGLNHENLHWMLLEADRRRLSARRRTGFIVFDEVQIQVSGMLAPFP
jgi:hypothetical protein